MIWLVMYSWMKPKKRNNNECFKNYLAMKKLMILAMMAVAATSTFAQGDVLKNILKSKDYAEAEKLLNANIGSLNAEQKAKAYNKLVEFSMNKISSEESTMNTNQIKVQMQQGEPEPYDTLGLFRAAYLAVKNGIECDKYDNMPNSKGKVSPKFHKDNQSKLYRFRSHLINGGQYAAGMNNEKEALDNYALYVESASAPLFADLDKGKERDEWLGEVARVAAVYSFNAKDYTNASRFCDIALADTASYKEAIGLKLYIMQQSMTTHEDSVRCMKEMEQLYTSDKNGQIFTSLADLYGRLGMEDKQMAIINERLASEPNNFDAWALKGQTEMNAKKWDEAIADFKKAIAIDGKQAIVYTYLGFSLNSKAAEVNAAAEQKALLTESLVYLEKSRELDPNRKDANWSYPLYQCYYALYGADDSRTKQLEALIK